jgi:hypothetical protein
MAKLVMDGPRSRARVVWGLVVLEAVTSLSLLHIADVLDDPLSPPAELGAGVD